MGSYPALRVEEARAAELREVKPEPGPVLGAASETIQASEPAQSGGGVFGPSPEPPLLRRRPTVAPALSASGGMPRIGWPTVHLRFRADRRLLLSAAGILVGFAIAFAVISLVRHLGGSRTGNPPPVLAPNRAGVGRAVGTGGRVGASDAGRWAVSRTPGVRRGATGRRNAPPRTTAATSSGSNDEASPSVRRRSGATGERDTRRPQPIAGSQPIVGPQPIVEPSTSMESQRSEREFGYEG